MSLRAVDALAAAEVVAGYTTYMDLIAPLTSGKTVLATPMRSEIERVNRILDQAMQGRTCALVCSGDPGIYALSGLVFEVCRERNLSVFKPGQAAAGDADGSQIEIEVVPGIPALASGAALLGAPLMHDFAVISLSDLLTPWDVIETRLEAAGAADFVVVLFNPKSKKRTWQLGRAAEILVKYRKPDTPVGIVKSAMRADVRVAIVRLTDLLDASVVEASVDMQTTVFIGSRASERFSQYMITPRGYHRKYELCLRQSGRKRH